MANGIVIGPVGLKVDVIAICTLDDIAVWLATLTDEARTFEAHMHVPWDKLSPALGIGLENALIAIRIC